MKDGGGGSAPTPGVKRTAGALAGFSAMALCAASTASSGGNGTSTHVLIIWVLIGFDLLD